MLELRQHGSAAAHEIERTHAVNRKDSAAGISIGFGLEAVGESLSPCTRGLGGWFHLYVGCTAGQVCGQPNGGRSPRQPVHGRHRLACAMQRGAQGRVQKLSRWGGGHVLATARPRRMLRRSQHRRAPRRDRRRLVSKARASSATGVSRKKGKRSGSCQHVAQLQARTLRLEWATKQWRPHPGVWPSPRFGRPQ